MRWGKRIYEASETLSKYINNHFVRRDQIRKSNEQKITIDTFLGSIQQVTSSTYYVLLADSILGPRTQISSFCHSAPGPAGQADRKQCTHLAVSATGSIRTAKRVHGWSAGLERRHVQRPCGENWLLRECPKVMWLE